MDQQFTMRFASRGSSELLALDYAQLTAGLAGQQAASATGVAATLLASPPRAAMTPPQALTTLFSGAPGWAGAVAALGGRFHPGVTCYAPSGPAPATHGVALLSPSSGPSTGRQQA